MGFLQLLGRAFYVGVGAKHTAVAHLRLQEGPAAKALEEDLAGINGHFSVINGPTLGTREFSSGNDFHPKGS
jgi:hypothetical protein